jgi:hypothetical protein
MMTEAAVKISDAELELQLPKPVGYRVLVALPQPEETISGTSIIKTDTALLLLKQIPLKPKTTLCLLLALLWIWDQAHTLTKTVSLMGLGVKKVTL